MSWKSQHSKRGIIQILKDTGQSFQQGGAADFHTPTWEGVGAGANAVGIEPSTLGGQAINEYQKRWGLERPAPTSNDMFNSDVIKIKKRK